MHPVKDIKNTFKLTLPAKKVDTVLKTPKDVKRYTAKSGLGKLFGILFETLFWWG